MSESNTEKKTPTSTLAKTKGLFEVVLKKWWIFLTIAILSGLGGIFYATLQKPVYKSKLTFALNDNGGGSMSGLVGIASQLGLNIGEGNEIFSGDNILEIMKSRKMVESVFLSTDTFNGKPYTLIQYYLNGGGLEPRQSSTEAWTELHESSDSARLPTDSGPRPTTTRTTCPCSWWEATW